MAWWMAAALMGAGETAPFDSNGTLPGVEAERCGARKGQDEVVVCGRRDSPYRIDPAIRRTLPAPPSLGTGRDMAAREIGKLGCPPTGEFSCDKTGKAALSLLQTDKPSAIMQILNGKPLREALGVKDPFKDYEAGAVPGRR